MNTKTLRNLSFLCFIIGILLWVPNVFFGQSSILWLLNFVIGPIGIVLSIMGKKYLFTFLNFITSFSFFIFMFLGYQLLGS
ncbi:hypothetical protein CEY02_18130 [Bacillus pumilus]|uniref:Uncharacterized protein n=1 Tax=Bacillus pumilus TaxID=1408 RepID=A0A2A5INZ4_BACPU|nr:hypothetical protein CEY02_18130 [Bacillus pumilus]